MTTKTIAASGGDYSTLAAWAAYVNALSLSEDEIGEVSGTVTDTGTVTLAGWTPNGFNVRLRAAAGEGVSAGGRAWLLTSGRALLTNSATYAGAYLFSGGIIVENLQLRATTATSSFVAQVSNGALVDRCILQQTTSGTVVARGGSGSGQKIRSSLLIANGGSGARNIENLDLERCTLVGNGSGAGLQSDYSQLKAVGCAIYNFATDCSGTALGGSGYNATSAGSFSGTGWGTNGQTGLSSADFVSTTASSEDYAAASGSTKLVGTGTAIAGVSADLFGLSVPQGAVADIGATEVEVVGPPAPVITGPSGSAGDATCAVNVAENQGAIGTWTATNGGTWSISGGADAARVAIDGSGVVNFVGGGKNFEFPDDDDNNGTYLFTVQNAGAGGTVTQNVTVTLTDVNEPPGAPTIGTATAGNASASVAFTPPAANGGPTPTSYTATSSPGGITGTGASSPIAVSGLTNGVEYTFTVTATNSEGTGPASAASNAVTPAAVTYSITSPAGGFALNTGSGARAAGVAFNWWAFAAKQIGDSLSGATMQTGSGTLNGSGQAVLSGLVLSGSWECQVRFADGGTARWTGTAV